MGDAYSGPELPLVGLLPITATIDTAGHLLVAGCDVVALSEEHGTPFYLYDEATIRTICREYRSAFAERLPRVRVLYAAKAFLNPALAGLLADEGVGMDIVSGGELWVAQSGGFPAEQMAFHGNNKSEIELTEAVEAGVGRIILDNEHELGLLERIAAERGVRQAVMLRVTPGIDAHTHTKTTTGLVDSKFGLPLVGGAAEAAVVRLRDSESLDLTGYHVHLGSPIFEMQPYEAGIAVMTEFAAAMRDRHGVTWREFSPGGGFALGYTPDKPPPPIAAYAETIATALRAGCAQHGLPLPEVHIEPGRSVVGRAGVAVYTVGARKEIPGVRTYVSVDGGMADNIRPAMYGSAYTAVVANRMRDAAEETVAIAGKFCESGDVLIKEIALPHLQPGDLVALPASGAYNLAMESNYNLAQRPPVLFLRDGAARLVRRRQTYRDLVALEEPL
ncbi:MAG: diaminopimelate decarboxylase [Chloroflexi bacterium]|nr:MAG: diaminopimelate decarboxylase [Chloroflexota bacterium]